MNVKELAEQSGMEWDTHIWCWLANPSHLEKFAELVRADERKACADLVFEMVQMPKYENVWSSLHQAQAAIRERGNHGQD